MDAGWNNMELLGNEIGASMDKTDLPNGPECKKFCLKNNRVNLQNHGKTTVVVTLELSIQQKHTSIGDQPCMSSLKR